MSARVMVVDNDGEMVELLQRHLEHEGYAVTPITSGPEALATLAREDFDVVLTDLVMDEVDGLPCCAPLNSATRGRASSS